MTNRDNDGLKKIYLFKSADYPFAEIDLSDNTLFLGESGVGKTTLMRVILFFYTMDSSASVLNINTELKKSFNQWYFQERNSHIVYEYQKEGKTFLFVLSNIGKLHYTFIEMSNSDIGIKDLFLEGKTPVTLEQLNENIERNLLERYHTTQKDKYIRTFHKKDMDGKRIKQESKIDFTLFETMTARKEFAKTLSNIFATSKVSADSVKKTIVSLIEDTSNDINLKNIRESLDEYIQFREEIKRFEKQIPRINELKELIEEHSINESSFKNYANQIYLLKSQSDVKLLELNEAHEKEKNNKEKVNLIYKPNIKELKDDIKEKNKQNIIENNEIEKLKKKKLEYDTKNIDILVAEHRKKKSYENSLEQIKSRYDALTANSDEVKGKYKGIFTQLEVSKDKAVLEIRDESRLKKESISNRKSEAYCYESEVLEEKTSLLLSEKSELEAKFSVEDKLLTEKKLEKKSIENFSYNQDNIGKYEEELKKFNDELTTLNSKIPKLDSSMERLDNEIASKPNRLKEQQDKLNDKALRERNKLIAKKESIEKKLDFDKENLYGYINKNELKERDKLLTFLKDEVLFSEKKLTIEKVANSSSVFGLEIEFEDNDFGFDYDVTSLELELTAVKEEIKELYNETREELNLLEESARKETSSLNRERTRFFKEKTEIEKQIDKYNAYIIKSKNSLSDANNEAKKMRNEALEKIIKELVEQKSKVDFLKSSINNISLKIEKIKKEIKANTKSIILKLDADLKVVEEEEKQEISVVEKKYSSDKKQSEDELANHLEAEDIDKEQLAKLDGDIRQYTQKLKAIDKNYGYVSTYLSEYEEKIKNIKVKEESLEKERVEESKLEEKLKNLQNEFSTNLDIIDEAIIKINKTKEKLNGFIKEYNDKIENQDIFKVIQGSLIPRYKEDISELLNSKEFLSLAVSKIINIYQKLRNNYDAIINKTQRATNGLAKENIFKLKIIDDYMKDSNDIEAYLVVAKALVEYIDKDKISLIKDSSSDKFISEFNAIAKYIDLFESSLLDVEEKVNKLDKRVRKAVESFNVIDAIKIKKDTANNEVFEKLKNLTTFYTQISEKLISGLFVSENRDNSSKVQNELANKIEELSLVLSSSKEYLSLEEGFVLTFRIGENRNPLSKPVQSLNDIGSNGTSTLVKSIIYISLLEMVNKESQILSHCILDEIGTISPNYFKELKNYANSSGFLFVNGMPTEDDILISMYPTVYIGQNYGKYSRMLLASKMVV